MTALEQPLFHLVAGPNGAGKTTFARVFLPRFAGTRLFLNPDLLAAGISPLDPSAAAIRAGRWLIREFDRLVENRVSFAAESTLSGGWLLRRLDRMKSLGYRRELYFLWIPSSDIAIARVAQRVRDGGHQVSSAEIRRRRASGLKRLWAEYVDRFEVIWLLDNSAPSPALIAWRGEPGEDWGIVDHSTWNLFVEGRGP